MVLKNDGLLNKSSQSFKNLTRSWSDSKSVGVGRRVCELIADIINIKTNNGIEHLVTITDGRINSNSR